MFLVWYCRANPKNRNEFGPILNGHVRLGTYLSLINIIRPLSSDTCIVIFIQYSVQFLMSKVISNNIINKSSVKVIVIGNPFAINQ